MFCCHYTGHLMDTLLLCCLVTSAMEPRHYIIQKNSCVLLAGFLDKSCLIHFILHIFTHLQPWSKNSHLYIIVYVEYCLA
uniref:Putative secreted protein n=1 Tax=Amblyomma cajennense TaxID=34607 RepID=A0A023FDG0_AMBCJ